MTPQRKVLAAGLLLLGACAIFPPIGDRGYIDMEELTTKMIGIAAITAAAWVFVRK